MSDPFFQKKRKRSGQSTDGAGPSRLRMRDRTAANDGARGKESGRKKRVNEERDSGDEDDEDDGGLEAMDTLHRYEDEVHESDEEQTETPAEARVRLAKLYIDSLREGEIDPADIDAAEIDRQNLNSRLQADASSHSTHVHNFVADRLVLPSSSSDTTNVLGCRGHRLSVTSAVLSADCASIWSASKDGTIVRWRLHDGKMMERIDKSSLLDQKRQLSAKASKSSGASRRRARSAAARTEQATSRTVEQGHSDEIWSLSASQDGQYLVSGGKDRRICVWRTSSGSSTDPTTFVKSLGGHKDSITGVRFRHGTHDLFSVSLDRTMKLFDVSQLSYVETFFGHQEEIADMDILRAELAVSAGSRDRTVRWWKVRDESQLVFRGGAKSRVRDVLEGGDIADEDRIERKEVDTHLVEGSVESVAMVDDHTFLSGGDSGTISLWSLAKKKPIFTVSAAHGFDRDDAASTSSGKAIRKARWITSLACLPYGDLFVSGSWDGSVRLWKLNQGLKSFSFICAVNAAGFVNSLQLVSPSRAIVKQRDGALIAAELWQRRGGLKGGPKKVFGEQQEGVTTNGNAMTDVRHPHTTVILVVGLGQEHKRGRWQRIREAQNGTLIVPFTLL